jgi:hypothetical protein
MASLPHSFKVLLSFSQKRTTYSNNRKLCIVYIANYYTTCTMKIILVLLTAMIGAVCGAHLGAKIQGVTSSGVPCTEKEEHELYTECVEEVAVSKGVVLSRRLELRGNRELQTTNHCGGCQPQNDWRGCWCFTMCGSRRLTVADEHVHTARFLVATGQIEQAAGECLLQKSTTEKYKCLGDPKELTTKIFLSPPTPPAPTPLVDLGSACKYTILAKTGISTVPNSVITGDIGVSPIAATAITGFSLDLDSSGQFSTASQVVGKAYAADYLGSTPADMTAAVSAMEAAYTSAAALATTNSTTNSNIGGETLTPGVYTFTETVQINSDLTFVGGAEDVFVIQTTRDLTQAASTHVLLKGGAKAKNIFWQVAETVVIGAGAHMEGIILCMTKVDFITGSSLVGSVLAQTAVNLQMANITRDPDTCN